MTTGARKGDTGKKSCRMDGFFLWLLLLCVWGEGVNGVHVEMVRCAYGWVRTGVEKKGETSRWQVRGKGQQAMATVDDTGGSGRQK
jgi:hypothetical protein